IERFGLARTAIEHAAHGGVLKQPEVYGNDWHGRGEIEYIPFPEHLVGAYQSFTEADLSNLRAAGYDGAFRNVADGVRAYLDTLDAQ
ncbi:MAG: hypothetical protein AAGJ36_03235, partial [Pseudomonadota bacterium]